MIPFFFKFQCYLYKCSNRSNRFHLKMESDKETAAAIVALLLVKKIRKREKGPCGSALSAFRFFVAVFINHRVDIP